MNEKSTPLPSCPISLSEAQLAQYGEQGFIAFENALSPEEVEAARSGITEMVQRHAFDEEISTYRPPRGKDSNQAGASFHSKNSRCFMQLEPGYTPSPERKDEIELKVRKFMWFEEEAPIFREIYTTHPRIQGVARSILGSERLLFQSMALIKPPLVGSEKPWHQDNAYFSVEDMDGILGTWIALDDVSVENGAMHFLPGGHRAGPLKHHHTNDCEILPDRYAPEKAVAVNMKAGGIIFFHGNAPHFTPANRSPHRRRALQYHYRRASNGTVSRETYDTIFKEADGTPASCAAAVPENF